MLPYRKMIAQYGITQSMSWKGDCFDNTAIESFFGTLKVKFFRLTEFDSIKQLDAGLHKYIRYYDYERINPKLNGLSLIDYSSQFATRSAIFLNAQLLGVNSYRGDSDRKNLARLCLDLRQRRATAPGCIIDLLRRRIP